MNKKLLLETWAENKQSVMLFFSSEGCGVCKEVKPLVEPSGTLKRYVGKNQIKSII